MAKRTHEELLFEEDRVKEQIDVMIKRCVDIFAMKPKELLHTYINVLRQLAPYLLNSYIQRSKLKDKDALNEDLYDELLNLSLTSHSCLRFNAYRCFPKIEDWYIVYYPFSNDLMIFTWENLDYQSMQCMQRISESYMKSIKRRVMRDVIEYTTFENDYTITKMLKKGLLLYMIIKELLSFPGIILKLKGWLNCRIDLSNTEEELKESIQQCKMIINSNEESEFILKEKLDFFIEKQISTLLKNQI